MRAATPAPSMGARVRLGAPLAALAVWWLVVCDAADIVQPPCDCIDPWEDLSDTDRTALGGSGLAVAMPGGSAATNVPLAYGAGGCAAYDEDLAPTCRNAAGDIPPSGRPGWCESRWCWVNASACQVRR